MKKRLILGLLVTISSLQAADEYRLQVAALVEKHRLDGSQTRTLNEVYRCIYNEECDDEHVREVLGRIVKPGAEIRGLLDIAAK